MLYFIIFLSAWTAYFQDVITLKQAIVFHVFIIVIQMLMEYCNGFDSPSE